MTREPTGIDFGIDPLPDLHSVLAAARGIGRAVPVGFFGDRAWLITGRDDVAAAFADEEALPSAAAYSLFAEPVQGRTLQCMTGAEHRLNRTLVGPAFRPAAIRAFTEEAIDAAARTLAAELDGEADLVDAFAARLPYLVITRLLGLSDAEQPDLRRWAAALFSHTVDPAKAAAGAAEFTAFLADRLAERRAQPRDDLLSRLATARAADESGTEHTLSDEEIFSFVRLLFPAGADTTFRAVGSLLFAVLSRPGLWERTREDPAVRRGAIEETLRWEPPVAVQPRRSVAPTIWGETTIPADAWVLYAVAAANRDPAHFPDPDRFDPGRPPSPATVTFGGGPHYCLGAHLARAEMAAALTALTDRFPRLSLTVPPEEVRFETAILRGPARLPVSCRP